MFDYNNKIINTFLSQSILNLNSLFTFPIVIYSNSVIKEYDISLRYFESIIINADNTRKLYTKPINPVTSTDENGMYKK